MNIKELCNETNIEYNSNHPSYSLNKIKQMYLIEQIGKRDYEIVRKLTKEEKENFEYKNSCSKYKEFEIKGKDAKKSGIYKIELGNIIYIGQTNNFYKRFIYHYFGHSNNPQVTKLLNSGATMQVVEFENDKQIRLEKESKWSYYYLSKGFDVINNFNVLYKKRKTKDKTYKIIKVLKDNYEEALQILKDNNIEVNL